MSDVSIGMLCAAAMTVATLFFRWLDRRSGLNVADTGKIVATWRDGGGDRRGLFTLVFGVFAVVTIASIPRLVTITLLLRGHVVIATAFLLSGLVWSAVLLVWGAFATKEKLGEAFDKEDE